MATNWTTSTISSTNHSDWSNCICGNLTKQTKTQTVIMFTIIAIQLLGALSNIICIYIVLRWTKSSALNRPKILMANVALSDTILTLVLCIPRFIVIMLLIDSYPLTAHITQSIRVFLENLTLHVEAFTITIIAWDRFYALTKVFNNPFDKIATKCIIFGIWLTSIVLSLPFIFVSDVDYFDYQAHQVKCRDDHEYLNYMSNNTMSIVKNTRRYFALTFEFLIPTLLVTWFSARIIFHLYEFYRRSVRGPTGRIRINSGKPTLMVTKRLITILFIFIMKNMAYVLLKRRFQIFTGSDVCQDKNWHFITYETFRITNTLSSVIFFWLSSEFRSQFRYIVYDFKSKLAATEKMIDIS